MNRFMKAGEKSRREKCAQRCLERKTESKEDDDNAEEEDLQEIREDADEDENIKWDEGRRIVELGTLANELSQCKLCKETSLFLHDTTKEIRYGTGSILHIRCSKCLGINSVKTNKMHKIEGKRGPGVFNSNSKIVIGMIDAGIGIRQLNKLLSAMGIPGVTQKTLKRREREITGALSNIAKQSCEDALTDEINQTRKGESSDEPGNEAQQTTFGLSVKYDMCWQKRGSGRSYNSASGVGSVIGEQTGKVLHFGIRSNHCRTCNVAEKLNKETSEHHCPKNWSQSSKAMEANTGAQLLQDIEISTGIKVSTLIMDDDSATLSRVQQTLGHQVEKVSDINHSKKSLGNAMYNSLQKKHKTLTNDVVKYFQKSFSYAIHQNKNNEENLKTALNTIVPHAFGDHSSCANWCKAADENYRHTSLPGGKDLTDVNLKNDLTTIFSTLGNNAHKLAPVGSTKDVESLNNIYASKAPKRICYSSSESLENRINASVSQKNIGYDYVNHLNVAASLSPSKVTKKFCNSMTSERKRQLDYSRNPVIKRRKVEKHAEKFKILNKMESKEGTTYKSDIGLTLVGECREIPMIRYRPNLTPITSTKRNMIIFDLETGSLQEDSDILQIAASSTSSTFTCYIQPTKPIAKNASLVTGLTSAGGMLFYMGRPVSTVTPEAAYQSFTLWLESQKPAVLVGHNAQRFDSRRLLYSVSQYSCFAEFSKHVAGFADTLPLFKELYPDLRSHSQGSIYNHLFQSEFNAHNALDDVKALKDIIQKSNVQTEQILKYSFSLESLQMQRQFDVVAKQNASTFDTLVKSKTLSSGMVKKISESGLRYEHLIFACKQNGKKGVKDLFSESRLDNGPRVTTNKAIIDRVSNFLCDHV